MNCRGILDVLSDYLEGDAGSAICKKIEEHLKGCERCRMHIDTMKKIIIIYKKWRTEPIPEDVQARLKHVVARECMLKGLDPAAAQGSRGASAVSARSKAKKRPAAGGRRKQAVSKQAKPSKRSPGKR